MQTQSFLSNSSDSPETVTLSVSLKLYSYPKRDREPVKILVIGSKQWLFRAFGEAETICETG